MVADKNEQGAVARTLLAERFAVPSRELIEECAATI